MTIKSIDTQQRAALGHNARRVLRLDPPTAGASADTFKPEEGSEMNVQEQIKGLEARRMSKAGDLEALFKKSTDEGRATFDEAEDEKYKELKADIETCDEHLDKLRVLESLQAARAKPVTVAAAKSFEDASKARDPEHRYITAKERLEPGVRFARYAKCLAMAKGNTMQALEIAKSNYRDDAEMHTVLKAAVAAGTTTDATWAGPLVEYQTLISEFIEYLRPQTIVGRFGTGGIPDLNRVPFNVRIQEETGPGAAYWVGEGAPKPLTSFDFTSRTFPFAKIAAITVLSDELIRFSTPSADVRVRNQLARAVVARMDVDFVDPAKAAVTNTSPASITNGIAPITSAGTGVNGVFADFEAMLAAFAAAHITPNALIMSSMNALALSMMRVELSGVRQFDGITPTGGTLLGLPVIVSQYIADVGDSTGSPIIMLNTDEVYLADDGQVTIDASNQASVEMLDNPTNNSATATATSLVSFWQTNSTGFRAERFVNWAVRRSAGVQWIEAAAYTAVQST